MDIELPRVAATAAWTGVNGSNLVSQARILREWRPDADRDTEADTDGVAGCELLILAPLQQLMIRHAAASPSSNNPCAGAECLVDVDTVAYRRSTEIRYQRRGGGDLARRGLPPVALRRYAGHGFAHLIHPQGMNWSAWVNTDDWLPPASIHQAGSDAVGHLIRVQIRRV
jgi:hypothetical protein